MHRTVPSSCCTRVRTILLVGRRSLWLRGVSFHTLEYNDDDIGVDPTPAQWTRIADTLAAKHHIIFFDSAYQGFASGDVDKDAYAVRHFVERGMEFLVAQSYSKNFGLYSRAEKSAMCYVFAQAHLKMIGIVYLDERCGCLVAVVNKAELVPRIRSQLAKIARPMISNPPAFGARIVSKVLNDPALYAEWYGSE